MELTKLLSLPDVGHLRLIGPMIVALEFVFFAFAGVALVSTALSLAHRKSNPALARSFAAVISPRGSVWLTLGLLPLLPLPFLLGQLVFGSRYAILDALLMLLPLAAVGLAGLWLYRERLNPFLGGAGALALAAFLLPFVNLLELIQWPERWPLVNPLVPDLYHVGSLVRVLILFAGAALATGGALLFRAFVWSENRLPGDAPLRMWALALTLVGALALPALVVWDAAMLPEGAQTPATLKACVPVLVVLWPVALFSCSMLLNRHVRLATAVSVLAFAGLAFEVDRQHAAQTVAIVDRIALIRLDAEGAFSKLQQTQEARYPSNVPLGPEAGAKIYNDRCTVCHAFDHKVVGPAHEDVLPKYRGDPQRLTAFIISPTRVDPAFPPMPAPGLSRREAQAVAEYLLKQLDEETKGGRS